MDPPAAGYGGDLGGGQGERPRSRPRLRLAGVGHLSSFAQGRAPDVGRPAHPFGVEVGPELSLGLGVGPEGLAAGLAGLEGLAAGLFVRGGIPSLETASVATRRNNWYDSSGSGRTPCLTTVAVPSEMTELIITSGAVRPT